MEEDDLTTAFYDDDQIDLGAADHGAVSSGAADEAAVLGGVQGPVPAVRHEPEHRIVRLQPRRGKIRGWRRSRRCKKAKN